METKQRIFPPLPQYERLDTNELVAHLQNDSPQIRAGVLSALASRPLMQSLAHITGAVRDERNRKTAWFGFITVSWVGLVALLETGDAKAQAQVRRIVAEWEEDEKQHLLSWLKDFPDYVQVLKG